VPEGFALGRAGYDAFAAEARARAPRESQTALPDAVAGAVAEGLAALPGPVAVRRSPLHDEPAPASARRRGGRPDRETYLHLTEPADVAEAVRRVWAHAMVSAPHRPVAVLVQRFFLPDASAVLRRDPARPEVLLVEAAYGIGDLLAAGLVVPDRYAIRAADGGVLEKKIGRKTQMSVPRKDGGVRRVPVPPALARTDALDDGSTAPLADLWRAAETAVGPLASLSVALSGREQRVTAAALAQVQGPQPG